METASYGTWESPLTNDLLSGADTPLLEGKVHVRFSRSPAIAKLDVNGRSSVVRSIRYKVAQQRPADLVSCIVEHSSEGSKDVLPPDYNARTRVHEYSGAAFAEGPDGNLVFSDWDTSGVFSLDPASGEVHPVIELNGDFRFASLSIHPTSPKWILAIQEEHHQTVENSVVAIDSSNKTVHEIAPGADFCNQPQFTLQGDRVCWIQWNFPDMPWTGTTLFTADWKDENIENPSSICRITRFGEPSAAPFLFFSSDRN